MTDIIQIKSVKETALWKILSKRDSDDARYLSSNVISLCNEAADRMKAMYTYASGYTLHDEKHLLRTTELMHLILRSEAEKLNAIELALLILSAFFHDQGMVLSNEEVLSLEGREDFIIFRDNWRIEHPNYREIEQQMNYPGCAEEYKKELERKLNELDTIMLSDFIRNNHGSKSAEFIRSYYENDKRIEIQQVNLAPYLAVICESHTLPSEELSPRTNFHYDEQVGRYTVNLPFLSVILRLADILDFDRDRAPEILAKSIHYTSPVSVFEWEKHRSIEGWHISKTQIKFTVKCIHPVYESAVREYMDRIDKELATCVELCRNQPSGIENYKLNLPSYVARNRIGPRDKAYRLHNIEFNLSRNEIVQLLMTDKLYGHGCLCIRELLQNSLDALRYRKALFSEANIQWNKGQVKFRHYVEKDGYEVLECLDNGFGMDEEIIKNYFVKVGRSFYRSSLFKQEMHRMKKSGNDFDPCSQFGIGFMSCFMLGDRITIKTRRDYGQGKKYGPPLIIEINGLNGLLVIRDGCPEQPIGTSVSIVLRQKALFIDPWTDKVLLCQVLKGYALANEFPIIGHCEIPAIKENITIPTTIEVTPTMMESAKLKNHISFEQNLSHTPNLRGFVKESFLIDDSGLPCLANSEAQWQGAEEGTTFKKWTLKLLFYHDKIKHQDRNHDVPVCVDGILVSGPPGRFSWREDIYRLGWRSSYIYSHAQVLIDAKGPLKPEITPGRTPLEFVGNLLPPRWQRLEDLFHQELGLLWKKLACYLSKGMSSETFWKLSVIYGISVRWIPCNTLWKKLQVSLVKNGAKANWCLIKNLGKLSIHQAEKGFIIQTSNGSIVGPDAELSAWEEEGEAHPHLSWDMNSIVLLMSCLDIDNNKIILFPTPPSNEKSTYNEYIMLAGVGLTLFSMSYLGNASELLTVQTPYLTLNRNHELVKRYYKSRYESKSTDLDLFAKAFIPYISQLVSTKEKTPSLDKPDYWQKHVGHSYFNVRWEKYSKTMQPPYKLWTAQRGFFSFTEDDFAKWRDVQMSLD